MEEFDAVVVSGLQDWSFGNFAVVIEEIWQKCFSVHCGHKGQFDNL